MKTGIYLSYVGLGANLLHLSYCHQIAKKHGPVTVITLCKNLEEAIIDDPLIEKVYYLNKYHKKFLDIFSLSGKLRQFNLDNLLIFYPSIRIYLSAKIANIKNISIYNIFKKKNLHLVNAAKDLTEKFLSIKNCPTETKFFIKQEKLNNINKELNDDKFKIVIGAGSSGATTRWGSKNFSQLINQLNELDNYFFFILCGPNEKEIENQIISNLNKKNYMTLSEKKIKDLIPYLCASDMYVGNDSFGSHITSQSGKKSIVLLLDSPKAYTDYSDNYYRIVPNGFDIEQLTHGSNADPNLISVNDVIEAIKRFKN
ncbi:lipopolysaccharide heptosyltransferase family protein [Candidatus Pelagibacter sp.]|jgi:ADP-heptose:LPS heptosyltransferase|nr:lipopolysaccharide heptosyltransferase family protein [Candidatus Pelagibacter sp.]|tara:strand:- start:511 stop:1449 length:939 start_codon:yes stop_codon:yes gene_type:complete